MMTPTKAIRLGDVEVPRIGLGTNRLTNTDANRAFLREAVGAGLRHIDTAHLYTGGDSERAIGAAFEGRVPDGVVIATKGGYGGAGQGRPEVLRAQIEQSLRSLRVEAIDLYYLHRVDPETPLEESLGELRSWVDRGAIRHVGLSDVTVEQLGAGRSVVPVAAVQNELNLGRRDDAAVARCEAEGLAFVPYYPLRDGPASASSTFKLAWLLHRSPAILPIPGTLSVEHLRDNLAALDLELSEEDLARYS